MLQRYVYSYPILRPIPEPLKQKNFIYTTLINFSTKYLTMYKGYTDVGGIK